jgi:hypothetical protein
MPVAAVTQLFRAGKMWETNLCTPAVQGYAKVAVLGRDVVYVKLEEAVEFQLKIQKMH